MFAIRGGAGVHRPAAHRQVRALVSRHARRGHDRDAPACPRRCRARGRAAVGRPGRHRGRRCAAAKASSRRSSSSRSRAPAASVRRSPAFLAFLRAYTERVGALLDLRRDHLVPGRARRGPGALRRPARPDDARQDHRRRLPAGGVRGSRGRHGASSTRGGRARSATAARSTAARSPRPPGWRPCASSRPTCTPGSTASASGSARAIDGEIERDGHRCPGRGRRARSSRSSAGERRDRLRDRRRRRPDALPRPPARRLLPRAARHGRDPRDRHRDRRR